MKITRTGATANHGPASVEIDDLAFKWNDSLDLLLGRSETAVRDFKTSAHHKYRMRFSLEEVANIISALSEDCTKVDQDQFIDTFGPVIKDMNRLIARASRII